MTTRATLLLALLTTTLAACTESVMIRSYPSGAKVHVDGMLVGIAPAVYSIHNSEINKEHRVQVDLKGYQPREEVLSTRTCPGRVVGAVFSFGISLLFKSSTCFVSPVDFALEPEAGWSASPGGGAPSDSPSRQPSIEDRLERLERMRDAGTISQEEYETYRKEILKGL